MTDPSRYDRLDPCEHCGEPRCSCDETWPEDGPLSDWMHPAWLEREERLRVVRDLRTGGEVL